ncbi:unnamed protein product [Spirodela intermedia]|uniref:Epidermal patterning factor-like protein n=1 Tax=Spirodela intermedia TaxID=51605 RepID=A0A7I8JAG7_SPIIN|nr:unnamed protein product [Spirodela intermedia]CAA6667206.1 unnamed protein product [Spirodela intermedia]
MGGRRGSRRRLLAVAAAAVALLVFATALGKRKVSSSSPPPGLHRGGRVAGAPPAAAELLHGAGDRAHQRRPAADDWPGSSPPTCRGRCGRCFPCRPIHVAVQPGESVTLEYYPEAWRCKCGSKLFMP